MSLKNRIIRLMSEQNLTVKQLSDVTGISEPTLKRLRSLNDSNPTLDVLVRLSKGLKTSVSDLIQEQSVVDTYYQDDTSILNTNQKEFTLTFTKHVFGFRKGARAIFRKYELSNTITKYIIRTEDCAVLETLDKDKLYFKTSYGDLIFVDSSDIFAVILKEIYEHEVSYV